MLLLASDAVNSPVHLKDPDGNLVCLVPPGHEGIKTFGVHYAVSDEAAFHRFYRDVLQLEQLGERSYEMGGAQISFAWSPDVVAGADTTGVGYNYLTFQVMNAAATHAMLCERGAIEEQPVSSSHTATDSVISFIRDPDGNRIEISQRPDLVAAARPTA